MNAKNERIFILFFQFHFSLVGFFACQVVTSGIFPRVHYEKKKKTRIENENNNNNDAIENEK